MLMNELYTLNKVSLNRNRHKTRLCIDQLIKTWPEAHRNLTLYLSGSKASVSTSSAFAWLCRMQLLWITRVDWASCLTLPSPHCLIIFVFVPRFKWLSWDNQDKFIAAVIQPGGARPWAWTAPAWRQRRSCHWLSGTLHQALCGGTTGAILPTCSQRPYMVETSLPLICVCKHQSFAGYANLSGLTQWERIKVRF